MLFIVIDHSLSCAMQFICRGKHARVNGLERDVAGGGDRAGRREPELSDPSGGENMFEADEVEEEQLEEKIDHQQQEEEKGGEEEEGEEGGGGGGGGERGGKGREEKAEHEEEETNEESFGVMAKEEPLPHGRNEEVTEGQEEDGGEAHM
eukprot:jgi/Undpi1/12832/HiC_scaffold_7.g02499.m1